MIDILTQCGDTVHLLVKVKSITYEAVVYNGEKITEIFHTRHGVPQELLSNIISKSDYKKALELINKQKKDFGPIVDDKRKHYKPKKKDRLHKMRG